MQTYEKENAIVTACIGSFKKIFSRFIDAEDMLLKENLTGDEAGEIKAKLKNEPRSDKRDLLAIKVKSEILTEKERPSCCEQLQKI